MADLLSATEEPRAGYQIVNLIVENVKRIEAVDITPRDEVVEITGKNGAGKSSVLDSIFWAIAGSRHMDAVPIRRGARHALIQLDLGDIIVRRTIRRSDDDDDAVTTALSVTTREGGEYRRPQSLMETFYNKLSLDPVAFWRMDDKERFALLRAFVPDVDFDAIERDNTGDFNRRRDINAEAKRAETLAAKFVVIDEENLPEAPIDIEALQRDLESAGRHNGEIDTRIARREAVEAAALDKRRRAAELDERAAELRAEAAKLDGAAASLREEADANDKRLAEAPPLPEKIATGTLLNRLNVSRGINTQIDVRRQREEARAEAARLHAEATALTERIAGRNREAEAKIAAAKLPVPGLVIKPNGAVLLFDLPFDQASDAEKLRASMDLAMAMSPKLRVIRVRDGSLLDEDGMRLVREMARARGCQIWIERVGGGGETGFELVEGRLAPAPAAA